MVCVTCRNSAVFSTLALLVLLAANAAVAQSVSYATAATYYTQPDPISVAVGDFNNDGIPDLAIASQLINDPNVTVYLGNGNGTFAFSGYYTAGSLAESVAVGDFNPNGDLDLAVPNSANHQASARGLSSLPADAQGPISAALGKDDPSYWAYARGGGLHAENPQHRLAMDFTTEGAQVRSRDARWELTTRAYGYGDALYPVNAAAPHISANRVEYRRGNLTEWYANGPLGLEQGFTLAEPPGKGNGQPLTIELALTGDVVGSLEPDRTTLTLTRKDGQAVLRYTGLTARDAAGQQLQSWLELKGDRLLLRIDDVGARYPVVIDPWVQQAELTSAYGEPDDDFGYSVALSGGTAVVGVYGSNNHGLGAAYVFVQSGSTWTQQPGVFPSDGSAGDHFGYSVAVSGSTAVVGAPYHLTGPREGAAYVFVQSGGAWSQQAELTASDGGGNDQFGYSVAVSGSAAVVGAPYHGGSPPPYGPGAAYVFVQNGSSWSQQAELTLSDGGPLDHLGWSVALSGSVAFVGAPGHAEQGAAYMFVQSGSTWSQQAELTASDGAAGDHLGYSVAVSGSTAIAGAPYHNSQQGAAYVFTQSGGTWSQQAELTASDGATEDNFGFSVAVSGSSALVGAPYHEVGSNSQQGAAYAFVQSGSTWTQQAELTSSDGAAGDNFGLSVAVSGTTAVAGAPDHMVGSNQDQGASYVFIQPGIYAPANGSTLTGTTVTFQWNGYPGATAYWLDVGSTPEGNNYEQTGSLSSSTLSYTVNGLPSDGSPVYATWWYNVNGQWQYTEYSYTAYNQNGSLGVITSPTPGSTLPGSTVTFSWAAGGGATAYWIDAGSTPGGNQYLQSGNIGNVTSYTVTGLPTNGSTVYVTLWSLVSGQWLNNQYTYTAYNQSGSQGVLTMPAPGSTLPGSTVTFSWSAGAGASGYWLDLGNVPSGNQYLQSGNLGNVLQVTANGLPTNGSTVYATLYTLVNGQWLPNAYTYTAFSQQSSLGVMQTPTPGSTLYGNTQTFVWNAGSGASAYWLDIGSTPSGNNYYQSGNLGNVLSTTVNTLPANGSQIYVTLWSLVDGQWLNNQYTYVSAPAPLGSIVISLLVDRSGSEASSGGGAALQAAIPQFLQYFTQGADYVSLVSYASSSSVDVPITTQFITPIDNAVASMTFIGGNFGAGAGTNPIYSTSYGPPLSMADYQNNSVTPPPGSAEFKAVVYFTDELMNTIQDQFSCTNLGASLYNYGGYAPSEGQEDNLYDFFNAANNNSNYQSMSGNDLSWWYANNGDNGGTGSCNQQQGGGHGTCGYYPPWNTTTACQGVTGFYSQEYQAIENFSWANITAEAQWRTLYTATQMRSESPVPTYVYVVGVGSNIVGSETTEAFLATLANDPNGPSEYPGAEYNPELPAGLFLIVPNCPSGACTNELEALFQTIAAYLP